MAFNFLSNIVSLLTSSVVYIAATIVFSKNTATIAALILALVVLFVILGVARAIMSPRSRRMKYSMSHLNLRKNSMRRMAFMFKRGMERKIISGSVARAFAFGTILFLSTNNIMYVYASAIVGLSAGIILMTAHRHRFVDLVSGAIIGCGLGFLSLQFAPILMKLLGF